MSQDSYPFPMYSGLLDPKHYKNIGSAIWLFLWCVSSTTKDVEKDGVSWGIVLGNKPIKREEISAKFDVTERTVQRWIDTLEQEGYIKITRAPYGMIFSVRNSKKFPDRSDKNVHSLDKNVQSLPQESGQKCPVSQTEWTEMSSLSDKNVHSNKDITVDITKEEVEVVDEADMTKQIQDIGNHFLKRRGRGLELSLTDYEEVKQLVADGVPSPFIKTCIDHCFDNFRPRHKRDSIRSISFIIPRIYDAWEVQRSSKAITGAVPHVPVAPGSPKRTKQQQQQFDELDRLIAEEEMKRGTD
ncbi:helix-turn-helix domain-containing protein [Paenibacillus daejeonensis]|uniref:helix-turn-helix domain-containing protein n=1 Tax=Paenibacillus daejeonensis TaxID=135193 RepID=UPI0003706ACA|nr:helix-turn-helix domain-containing protein [Paenibacillus daejeonensis]